MQPGAGRPRGRAPGASPSRPARPAGRNPVSAPPEARLVLELARLRLGEPAHDPDRAEVVRAATGTIPDQIELFAFHAEVAARSGDPEAAAGHLAAAETLLASTDLASTSPAGRALSAARRIVA